ncbi:putative HNHc nuclease [Caldicoprobacter algeriensis]|uniref:putative HNHc nuclease n=1 Tax=Caldicoprobacter algeriensis TaxID=699281 RepID=UPI0020796C70
MRFKCRIDTYRGLKKSMKLTLELDKKQAKEVLRHIDNFMDMPLIAELVIDNEEQARRLQQISPEQRKKIYAILRDMEAYTGESVENLKEQTKQEFIQNSQWEDFSLSDCSRELAADYIEYLINLCFEMGIPLSENPADGFDDVDRYLIMCLQKRICCVCGMPGEIHHVDSIGIGRDRTKIDDSKHRKICLCRKHHTEAHTIGMKAFEEKYHVYGIIWEQ